MRLSRVSMHMQLYQNFLFIFFVVLFEDSFLIELLNDRNKNFIQK